MTSRNQDDERPDAATLRLPPDEEDPALAHTIAAPSSPPTTADDRSSTMVAVSPLEDLAASTLPSLPPIAGIDEPVTHEAPGRYERRRELGSGGLGKVDVVWDAHLKREVALKQLHAEVVQGSTSLRGASDGTSTARSPVELRFLNEARLAGVLEHPGIVPVHELGRRADGSLYYTMPLVRGRTLAAALEGRDLGERLALLPNLSDLCQAVAYAHEQGVVHRDLKPENVMLGDFGETVILDFGLAKLKGTKDVQARHLADELERLRTAEGSKTVAGMPMGTPAYMPPEQARGDLDAIDARSDVYALGAILFEVLTGRAPYVGSNALAIVSQVLATPAPDPLALERRCPPELAAIARRCLEHDPERRYSSAKELADELQAFLTGGLVRAHHYGARQLLWRWIQRYRVPLAAAAVVLAGVVGAWSYRGHLTELERQRAEAARLASLEARATAILQRVRSGDRADRWLDTATFRLTALRDPVVTRLLQQALLDPSADVRRVAARALGASGGKGTVPALTARLAKGAEQDDAVQIEIVRALGILADPRAEAPVAEFRRRLGSVHHVYKATEHAYRMIPLPPIPAGATLSAEEWKQRGDALQHKATNRTEHQAALDAYDQALAIDPRDSRVYNNKAISLRAMGDWDRALAAYTKSIEIEPTMPALVNRAVTLRNLERFDEALKDLNAAARLGELPEMMLRQRSKLRLKLHDFAGAEADARAAIKAEPRHVVAWVRLAAVFHEQNELKQARETFEQALKINPHYLYARLMVAQLHVAAGDLSAGETATEAALAEDPKDFTALALRAFFAEREARFDDAKKILDAVVEGYPEAPEAWGRRGLSHLLAGRRSAALADLAKAVELSREPHMRLDWVLMRAAALLRVGDAPAARRQLDAVPRARPGTFLARVGALLDGSAALDEVAATWITRSDLCTMALATGVRHELAGDPAAARAAYATAASARRPTYVECRLAALSAKALAAAK